MPLPRFRLRTLMIAVAVAASWLALVAYRETLRSLDNHDGLLEGLVILAVDIGMMIVVPALFALAVVHWGVWSLLRRLGDGHWHAPCHEHDSAHRSA